MKKPLPESLTRKILEYTEAYVLAIKNKNGDIFIIEEASQEPHLIAIRAKIKQYCLAIENVDREMFEETYYARQYGEEDFDELGEDIDSDD